MCLGVVLVLLGLLVPRIMSGRRVAANAVDLANIRALGMLVVGYSMDYRDRPPVLFEARAAEVFGEAGLQVRDFRGVRVRGEWFDNASLYHLALSPFPGWDVLNTPGAPQTGAWVVIEGSRGPYNPDYMLSETLYAQPEYFTEELQIGPRQWGAQALTAIRFPSMKVMMGQTTVYGFLGSGDQRSVRADGGVSACCYQSPPSAVLWGDLSASTERQSELRAGVPNRWYQTINPGLPPSEFGLPVHGTAWGIWGRDR